MPSTTYSIIPTFTGGGDVMSFNSGDLNRLLMTEPLDLGDAYQRQFGVYSYMPLTEDRTFRILYPQATSVILQPGGSCIITPMGQIVIGEMEVEPCKAEAATQMCQDELMGSCFKALVKWQDGIIDDAQYVTLVNEIARMFAVSVTLGAKMAHVMGQYYSDVISYTAEPTVPQTVREAFEVASAVCTGWVKALIALADMGYAGANNETAFSCTQFTDDVFTGDVLVVYDNVKLGASKKLRTRIIHAYNPAFNGRPGQPIILVSSSFYAAIVKAYTEQCENPACINKRLGLRNFGSESVPFWVYTIDGLPVIPITEVNEWDEYTTGETHLFVITVSGNIQLGTSFSNLRGTSNFRISESGILLQRDPDIFKTGLYKMRSSLLTAVAIADKDLIAGSVKHCA